MKSSVKKAVEAAMQHARQSSTGWWRANCPECLSRTGKADHKQCLAINVKFGAFKCWKCGLSGKLPGFEDQLGASIDPTPPVGKVEPPVGFISFTSSNGVDSISLEPARAYMRKRCPESLWQETGVGACISGDFAGRVIIPIHAEDGHHWVGWVGRTWFPSEKAYTYPKGMNRGASLYQARILHEITDDPALVVEGVFDAIHLWPRAVALLGKASNEQMTALENAKRPVVMVLDGDAWTEGYSMAMRLRLAGQRSGYVRLPPTLDPDEVPASWLDEEIKHALA